jgi:hypothetical protein
METQTERLVQTDEGIGSSPAASDLPASTVLACGPTFTENLKAVESDSVQEPTGTAETPAAEPVGPPKGYEGVPPELWPDKDGNPPVITERLLRSLRGKYFTVRHVRLGVCGHLLDMINQPRNNCEQCWFQFYNTHPQLVEVADQFFRTHGKKPMIGMRGEKFVKMFLRYMATIIHLMKQEGRIPSDTDNQQGNDAGSVNSEANVESNNDETRASGTGDARGGDDQGRKVEGGRISSGLIQHEG